MTSSTQRPSEETLGHTAEALAVAFPGARRPDRRVAFDVGGVSVSRVEWGPTENPPLLMAHGGFDFAETLNVFAPLLVARGWRVISWDQRGHGHSDWADLYSFEADIRDACHIVESVDAERFPLIGHSKGGALSLQLATLFPHRFTHLVNIDGLPSHRSMPDVAEHERTRMMSAALDAWLTYRGGVAERQRKPGTIAELAERRGRMNTRATAPWLQYLVTVGGRRDADGWRWRIDPTLRMGGFGPWRPEWSMQRLPGLTPPLLALLGGEPEVMGWGTLAEDVEPFLPHGGRLEVLEGLGHFLHIEAPERIAELVCEFLGAPT